ncbi:hypothetical protein Q664_41360 [Archangium violaceum Cb vi76]|uniref:Knr4/Smi1-like domain-containing protein n=2 Tax=Archangium violaceum TaxID=83451 RepID=A0A084SJ32_9BACT|nr:hypothetical protein Q664_41360 [Archangium violaceum Cb vi76]
MAGIDGFLEGSMMDIRWENYVWKEPRPVASSELERLEDMWQVALPGEFKRIAAAHQGMAPEPCVFKVGRGANVFSVLLTVTRDADRASYSIQDSYDLIRSHVPSGIYPFGKTPGGEYLCFDYRGAAHQPQIVLVTVEMSVLPVANSFQELLEGLHDD